MTPSEAATLLGHIAAFDRRTVGKTDAHAWARALHDLPLDDDTLDAVAQFFGDPQRDPEAQRWIQPHHVRTARQQIRAARIEAANLVHEPEPDETPRSFIERRRAQLAAAGSGLGPRNPSLPALEGGPHPTVARMLTAAVRTVPASPSPHPPPYVPEMAAAALASALPRRAERDQARTSGGIDVLSVPCSWCQARPGQECRRRTAGRGDEPGKWHRRATPHPSRVDAAAAKAGPPHAG